MNTQTQFKLQRLRLLAQKRVATNWPTYRQPENYGYSFQGLVSPYSRTAGNVDADIMIVLQDWASHDFLTRVGFDPDIARLGHAPTLKTNVKLKDLLWRHLELRLEESYGTNLFPFVKAGGMSAHISDRDLLRAAKTFTLQEIDIVQPRAVLALGSNTAKALVKAGATVHALPHPAARISTATMEKAWADVAQQLAFRQQGIGDIH